jgi:hypothetical protein
MFDANILRIRSAAPGVVRINTRRANEERAMSGRAWMVGRAAAAVVAVALLVTAVAMAARGLTVVTSSDPPAANAVGALVAPSPNEIWAVGESASPGYSGCHGRPLAGRWDGPGFADVKSVAARSATDAWAVGSYDDVIGDIPIRQTPALHWNGSPWKRVASQNVGSDDNRLSSIVAPRGVTDVGASGTSADGTLIEHLP